MNSRSCLVYFLSPLILNSYLLILGCAGPANLPQSGAAAEEACLEMANAFCARVTQCLISPDCQDDLRDIGFTCEDYTGNADEASRCALAFSEFECDYLKFGKVPVSCPLDAPHKEYAKPGGGGTDGGTGGGGGGGGGGGTNQASCGANNACGAQAPSGCWCDNGCDDYGDCCADACSVCGACGNGGVGGGGGTLNCSQWLDCIGNCADPNQAEICVQDCSSYLKSDSVPVAQALYDCIAWAVNDPCFDPCSNIESQACTDCLAAYCEQEILACLGDT